jgi:carbonic anhydrase
MCDDSSHSLQSRRQFLGTSLGLLALSTLMPRQVLADAAPPQNAISPDAALRRLLDGNARYASNQLDTSHLELRRFARCAGAAV